MATTRAHDLTGQTFGRLRVLERADNIGNHAAWLCACACGVQKVIAAQHLKNGQASCGCWRAERAALVSAAAIGIPRITDPTYSGAHARIYMSRGSATGYACVDCGRVAEEWSYSGEDPDELVGKAGLWDLRYSTSPSYYEPRCKPCHKVYDLGLKAGAA